MKHTYHIHGMTCNGCRSHVEKILSEVEGVSNAAVHLEKEEATIEMDKHIPIEKFQEALKKMMEIIVSIQVPTQLPQRGGATILIRVRGRKAPFGGWGTPSIAQCIAKAIRPMTNPAIVQFAEWT